jgi:prephenate dehydratase
MSVTRVAYLGIPGSYSHQAAQELFPSAEYLGCAHWPEIFAEVETGRADAAVVPVENALSGRIDGIYQELSGTDLHITNEFILPVHHCLLGARDKEDQSDGADLSESAKAKIFKRIKTVYSHPQGFLQCAGFIAKAMPAANQTDTTDTANAAQAVARSDDPEFAAISSRLCATLYGLRILEENIEDEVGNATRFLVLEKEGPVSTAPFEPAITTLLFKLKHEPGALVGALSAFADLGINLTKLETYMASRDRRKPTFYVDIGDHINSSRMMDAMAKFADHVEWWKMLGTYHASELRGVISGFLAV